LEENMNIDDLTLGQIKQIQALIGSSSAPTADHDSMIGKYVLIRCSSAGVHAGELISQKGDVVELKDSRRLWQWTAADGVALSGVAQYGLKAGKIDVVNPIIRLVGAIETIPCTEKAKDSINGFINK
jgi:hypothetical protein